MLYHVTHLDRGLSEIARVLRPGGRLVAITNGEGHLSELWSAVGEAPPRLSFNRSNGAELLRRRFGHVEQHSLRSTAVFLDHASIAAYLGSVEVGVDPARLAGLAEPFEAHGEPTVFIADKQRGGRAPQRPSSRIAAATSAGR